MNVYFATSPSKQHMKLLGEEGVRNFLISYAFIKKPEELIKLFDGYKPERLIIDSGAFSVWSNGGSVDIDKYADFCTQLKEILPECIDLYIVNLDVLPGEWGHVPSKDDIDKSAEQGWKNMLYLESKGLKVIHVFHQHEDWEVLDKLSKHSDYIGISPANDVSQKEKDLWMNQVFSRIKDTVKTHGFAVTSHNQLYKYPYYSADSSSWVTPARYGRIAVMNNRHEIKSFSYKNINEVEPYWEYIREMGFEKIAHPTWQDRTRISIRTYMKLEEIATKLWTARGVVWDK